MTWRRRFRRSGWTVLGAVATSAAALTVGVTPGGATSGAADRWGPVHRFEQNTVGEAFVQDARGVTTVLWGSQRAWPEPVKARQRGPGGRWRAAVTLGEGHSPVVAADGTGTLVAAWIRDEEGRTASVWSARKAFGRAWSTPVRLSRDLQVPGYPDGVSNYGAVDLDVAVRDDGAALVAWRWGSLERDVPFRAQASFRRPRQGWEPARTLSRRGGDVGQPRAALASAGAWVGYAQDVRRGPDRVVVRSRQRNGSWSAPVRVGTGDLGTVALTDRRDVVAVFRQAGTIRSAVKPRGGRWQAPVDATPAGVRARGWSAAVNRRGQALVTYLSGPRTVTAVRRAPGGRWTAPEQLAEAPWRRVAQTYAAVSGRGAMVAAWDDFYGVWSRHRPAGRAWGATTNPHPDRGQVDVLESVRLGISPGGRAGLLWAQEARPLALRLRVRSGS